MEWPWHALSYYPFNGCGGITEAAHTETINWEYRRGRIEAGALTLGIGLTQVGVVSLIPIKGGGVSRGGGGGGGGGVHNWAKQAHFE